MTIRIIDRLCRIAPRKIPAVSLAIGMVSGAGITSEMSGLVDECSAFGIGARDGCWPECTTEVDVAKIVRVDISVCIRSGTSTTVEEILRISVPIEVIEMRSDCRMVWGCERPEPGGEPRRCVSMGIGIRRYRSGVFLCGRSS